MLRVILTTGGTGGHVFPALAVAEELRRQAPRVDILFIGGRYGQEQHWVREAGIDFAGLPVRGVLGRGMRSLGGILSMGASVLEAMNILSEFKPDVVVGFGSYASFPGVAAAVLRRCPVLIHEQNAFPGLSNRILSRFARRICLAIPDRLDKFPKNKTTVTGNPVRSEITDLPGKSFQAGRKRLLIMGGSQGAASINRAVLAHLDEFRASGVEIWHQTGNQGYVNAREVYSRANYDSARVQCFIDNVAEAYQWADLTVCRAGASTVAELAVSGMPSVLVPYPHATHNHQLHNAEYMQEQKASILIKDEDLNGGNFARSIIDLLNDTQRLEQMSHAARSAGHPDASGKVVECIKLALPEKIREEYWESHA